MAYDGPPTEGAFVGYIFDRLAYSDVSFLYFRDGLTGEDLRPYLDYPFEYPVGTGLVVWLLTAATNSLPGYFLATSLFLGACGLLVVYLVPEFPRGEVWLVALSPALALYVNLNWDMWGVLLMTAALLLFVRGRDACGAVALAAAVWTKFFPVLFLPLLLADRLRGTGWRAAGWSTLR